MKAWRVLVPVLALGLGACQGSGGPPSEDVVARAGGFEFTAQAAAEILAPQFQLPNQPEVVEALADLWVQYYLLAKAAAEDTTLANVDVDPLVKRQVEGELVTELRDRVIQVDTAVSDEELRARFEASLPGGQVRARHILFQFPEGASDSQVDSVRALVASVRSRLIDGEDFGALAREYSQDPGSAARGGDLGSFGKGEMAPAFEAAAFTLAEGEVSEAVESTFGLHLIRVDERILPPFEEGRDQFRAELQTKLVMEAESTYVAGLVEAAGMEPRTDVFETVRQVASDPDMELTSRALDRTLIQYDGGAFSLGEFREWLLTSSAEIAPQVQDATDDQLSNLLLSLARSELLVNAAVAEGVEIPSSRRDSMTAGIIAGVKSIALQLGFFQMTPQEGESLESAADRVVRGLLVEIVQEGREVFPLQTIGFALKEQYGAGIFQAGVARTMELIDEIRVQTPTETVPVGPAMPVDTTPPDTTGEEG